MFRRFLPLLMGFAVFAACTSGSDTNGPDTSGPDANGSSDGAALVTTVAPARADSDSVSESATTLPGTDASVLDVPDLTDDQWSSAAGAFGWVFSETVNYEEIERLNAIDSAREEAIAACMRRDGFEYRVVSWDVVSVLEDPDRPRGTSEWRDRYGFGVTTMSYEQSEVGPEVIGYDPAWMPRHDQSDEGTYYGGLTEAAKAKYDESRLVCSYKAEDEVPDLVQDARGTLAVELKELDERVRALSAYAQLRAEFNECLAEPGLVFEGIDSIERYLLDLLSEAGYFDEEPSDGAGGLIILGVPSDGRLLITGAVPSEEQERESTIEAIKRQEERIEVLTRAGLLDAVQSEQQYLELLKQHLESIIEGRDEQHLSEEGAQSEEGKLSEEEREELIIEVQTLERDLASKCGGLAEWERRYAELADPFRREFAATHFELVGP